MIVKKLDHTKTKNGPTFTPGELVTFNGNLVVVTDEKPANSDCFSGVVLSLGDVRVLAVGKCYTAFKKDLYELAEDSYEISNG